MSKQKITSKTTSFWTSTDNLTIEGFKVIWFGIAVSIFGLIFTDLKWVSWFGIGATILGQVLRHRAQYLNKIKAAPRMLSAEQKSELLNGLKSVPKLPITVGFCGQDPETKAYATELKIVFESAGFSVVRLEGFLSFDVSSGLEIVAFNSDSASQTAVGIQKAMGDAGLEVRLVANPNKMQPTVSFNVHIKPNHSLPI